MSVTDQILETEFMHYGVSKYDGAPGRGSGRYPAGSGKNPNQHGTGDILTRVKEMEAQGLTEKQRAEALGLSTTQLRVQLSIAKDEERSRKVAAAKALREQGLSLNEIAEKMGFANDSSVRTLLNENSERRMNQARVTADYLKKMIDEKGIIDVGKGVERELGVSREKLEQALYMLELEGYPVYGGGIPQVTNKQQQTNVKVICPPGTEHKEMYNFENIHSVKDYDQILIENGEGVRKAFEYPSSMDSSRLAIRYAEDGGLQKDGVVEIRRGVADLSLGESHYAQVRILVDGTHYIKGMAVYSDDLPDGVDVMFNTNKKRGTPAITNDGSKCVLKPIHDDPENPFGSLIKEHGGQSYFDDPNGKYIDPVTGKHQSLSLINKRAEEGDWNDWSDHLPSQFLAKQPMPLINKQLGLAKADKQEEFDEIMSLTNPTVKKRLLSSFADDCDSAAVHLQAAALPRQKYRVILPVPQLKDTEIYAPGYENGEQVALIRYPHGGTFEIPILTVNNKQPNARSVIGTTAKDAVGINSNVAERLSGADFDGDTVMVIPCNNGRTSIKSTPALKGLEGFDPKMEYGATDVKTDANGNKHYYNGDREFKHMRNTQNEMGKVSNLITDMTLKGANDEELARAVRHSMVVIDAEKHHLDYKQSELDNRISELKSRYQGHYDEEGKYHEGVSTLISAAKSPTTVTRRQGSPRINEPGKEWYDPSKPLGSLIYKDVENATYVDPRTGKTRTRTQASTRMADVDDAYKLVSDWNTPQERAYADYANSMKGLANKARMAIVNAGSIKYDPSAKATYSREVESLNAKLDLALRNAPRERQALAIANSKVEAQRQAYEDAGLSRKEIEHELKNVRQRELTQARLQVGAERHPIEITDKEWEAIQLGAISENKLAQILNHTDIDDIRQRATPRATTTLSEAKQAKIEAMADSGYTIDEISKAVGVSTSTVSNYL